MGDWRLVLPPSRPSPEHLLLVDEIIRPLPRSASIAILGSTPEYREVLNRRGFNDIYVFEKNVDFYKFATAISHVHPDETLIVGDWRETLSSFSGKFDIIFSHLTSGNIDYDSRSIFFNLIALALKSTGKFVNFELTNEVGYIERKVLLDKFHYAPVNIAVANIFSCLSLFCSEYAQKMHVVDTNRIYEELYHDFPLETHPLIDLAQYVTPRGGLWYYGKEWREVEAYQSNVFDVVVSIPEATGSPYFSRARHNVMRSKIGM